MSDKLNDIKHFLKNSGFDETLQILERESNKFIQKPDPAMNFTFQKNSETNHFRPADSFGNPDFSNKFHSEPTSFAKPVDSPMRFDSPHRNSTINKSQNGQFPKIINPYKISETHSSNRFDTEIHTNEENFSFGEDLSDNEINTKPLQPYQQTEDPFVVSHRMKSENFIRLNKNVHPSNHTFQDHSPNAQFLTSQVVQMQGHPQSFAGPHINQDRLGFPKRFSQNSPIIEFPGNTNNYRARSIRSRPNSVEKESAQLTVNFERLLNFGQQVTLSQADQCRFIRH